MKVGSTKKKTKAAPAASKPSSRLAALISRINTKFGKGTAICASEAAGLEVRHLPTGAARLDIALGGGWPIGRIIEVFGPESSGKTTLMLSTITQFQRMFQEGVAVFIDLEKSYDPKYASRWGVDTDRLILINADSGEQGSDLIAEVANEELDMLVIVDSIAAMTPTAESEASMDANFVGAHPRLINRTMRVCTSRMKRSLADPSFPTTTAIFLNQVREKIGVMFGDPETTPGGKGKNFFASLRLRLFMSTSKKNRIVAKVKVSGIEKEEVVARRVSFNVVKNKCGGIPFEEGDFLFYLKKADGNEPWSFDNARALFEYGRYYRIITVDDDGAFTYTSSTDNITIAEKRERAFLDALRSEDNAALVGDLYTDIMAAVNRSCAGELVVDEAAESESDVDSGDESSED